MLLLQMKDIFLHTVLVPARVKAAQTGQSGHDIMV